VMCDSFSRRFASNRKSEITNRKSFHFLVRRVLAALLTELAELQPLGGRLAILGCRVIAVLALAALQGHDFPWHVKLLYGSPALPSGLVRVVARKSNCVDPGDSPASLAVTE
jgi:hypothetical protein